MEKDVFLTTVECFKNIIQCTFCKNEKRNKITVTYNSYNVTQPRTTSGRTKCNDRRARQRCFWLLAFIKRHQVCNIHLPERIILPGSLFFKRKFFFFLFQATLLQLGIFVVVKYMHHRDDLVEHRTREASFGAQYTNPSANSMSFFFFFIY